MAEAVAAALAHAAPPGGVAASQSAFDLAHDAAQARAWAELASEIDRLNRTDPRLGLERATAWLAREQARGSREGTARALRAQAHALRFLGQYDRAIAQYEEVERQFRAIGLDAEAARTEIGHVTALRYKGRYQEAVDLALQTRAYFDAHGDALQAAKQAMNLGTVYRPMGRLREAVRVYREARAVFRRLGERSLLADVEQNLGNVLVDLGEYERALRHIRAAQRIRRQLGLRTEVALASLNIGILCHRRGDYGRALQELSKAREIFEAAGVDRSAHLVDLQMLETCVTLNLRDESVLAADRAIDGLRRLAMPFELGQALLAAASLADTQGDAALARARIAEARALFRDLGNQVWEDLARLQEAHLIARQAGAGVDTPAEDGDAPDADAAAQPAPAAEAAPDADEAAAPSLDDALVECRAATASLEQAGALDGAVFGLLIEGAIQTRLGDREAARRCFEQAREAGARLNADHLLFQAHTALGELHEEAAPSAAVEAYRRAIDHLEAVRARALTPDLKVSFLTDKASVYERIVGLLIRDPAAEEPSSPVAAEAYQYVERSKSRTLLEDLLAAGGQRAGRGGARSALVRLSQRVRDLRTRLNTAYMAAYGADAVPTSDSLARAGGSQSIAELEQALAVATRELQLVSRQSSTAGAAGAAGAPAGDGTALAAEALPEGVTLIEFYSAGEDLLAFVRRGSRLVLRTLAPLADLERLVERLSFQMGRCSVGAEYALANIETLRKGVDRCLQQLYRLVVEPLADELPEAGDLVVVPHGPLHGVPFHAFHDGARYLAERYTITYAPSAGVYQSCRRTARPLGGRALVVGIDDPALPWVPREVESVAGTWTGARTLAGSQATLRRLWRQAGTFDVLHLATHGVFRADNPAFSSVKLADAWLTVSDLAEVARGAQLVTLSACETGVSGLNVGDEVVGLTRGLLSAGCTAVVASLWTVSDESTARLMERFYVELRGGQGAAAALGAAMADVRAAFDHPYFWAPFVVIGHGLGDEQAGHDTPGQGAHGGSCRIT